MRVDHGTEVREHGQPGVDRGTEEELARRREQVAREHASYRDETVAHTRAPVAGETQTRTNVLEEVSLFVTFNLTRVFEFVPSEATVLACPINGLANPVSAAVTFLCQRVEASWLQMELLALCRIRVDVLFVCALSSI